MKAMILAAGRGARLGPLTDRLPKPLLVIQGKPLIEHQINQLVACGITEIVINVCYLGVMIQDFLGNGGRFNCHIQYSVEDKLLDTGGGIFRALPLLGNKPFLVLNGDILTDFSFSVLGLTGKNLAHLVLVDKPVYHETGDFSLMDGFVTEKKHYTFAGIAVYHPDLFTHCSAGKFSIVPLLREAIASKRATGEYYSGDWHDIGLPEGLLAFSE